MRALLVASPGSRTTVEDLGRRMVARFGVPAGGAFDPLALAAANRLVGNRDGAAGLEITLGGPTLVNHGDEPLGVALVGADCRATVRDDGVAHPLCPGSSLPCPPGAAVKLGFARDGARAWLAVAGGIAVPERLGSRSTCLAARFGGLDGRALRAGDVLPVGPAPASPPGTAAWHDALAYDGAPALLRIVPGPQAALCGDAGEALGARAWRVHNDSDRTGIRLVPADASSDPPPRAPAGIAPEGTTLGAIQLPPDGCPIVLGPDRPVTGGYAKPALVIAADVGRLARLRPGDVVRFTPVSLADAATLARERRATLPAEAPA